MSEVSQPDGFSLEIERLKLELSAVVRLLEEYSELVNVVSELLELVEPCDVDPQRDYCVTHHTWHCQSDGLAQRARELIDFLTGEETKR